MKAAPGRATPAGARPFRLLKFQRSAAPAREPAVQVAIDDLTYLYETDDAEGWGNICRLLKRLADQMEERSR